MLDGGVGVYASDTAGYNFSSKGVRVDLARTDAQIDFDGTHGFVANNNEAVGDILINIERIDGSDYNDWLTGDGNRNTLRGGTGNDRIEGGAGNDYLGGDAGNDYLYGGAGSDRLYGSTGSDTIYGEAGNDNLYGGAGNDILYGGAGNDYLIGGASNDYLDGGAGNDAFEGGAGKDTLDGGEGTDIAGYYSSSKGVRVALSLTTCATRTLTRIRIGFTANNNDEAVGDILSNIERHLWIKSPQRLADGRWRGQPSHWKRWQRPLGGWHGRGHLYLPRWR